MDEIEKLFREDWAKATPPPDYESCLVFGMPRGGSVLMDKILHDLTAAAGVPFAVVDYLFNRLGIIRHKAPPTTQAIFKDRGFIYGLREVPQTFDIPFLLDHRKILLVRDARDVLVSNYFYVLFGNQESYVSKDKSAESFDALQRGKDRAKSEDINDFVLRLIPWYRDRIFTPYAAFLNDPTARIYRYEDVLFDKAPWVADMARHLRLDVPESLCQEIAARHDILPKKEDPGAHVRKATPGDHRDKLSPETIQTLNKAFGPLLRDFGYDL
ncbi:MAG: sulfotransferase domain-containing protein [Magnetospiraceae bacterium]